MYEKWKYIPSARELSGLFHPAWFNPEHPKPRHQPLAFPFDL